MIRLALPFLPPSSNHAYFNLPRGGRSLSAVGKSFLAQTKAHLAQNYRAELRVFELNIPFTIAIRFVFEEIETKGFTKGKAQFRYKRFDGGNRTKLLEDALKDAGGIDDAQTLTSIWTKTQGSPEQTILWIWSTEKERSPFDELIRGLP